MEDVGVLFALCSRHHDDTFIIGHVVGDTLGDSKGKYYGGRTLTGKKALPVLEIHGRTPPLVRPIRVVVLENRSN